METKCTGTHEIYVAEVVAIETEGKIVVVTVCRHCDKVSFHEKQVANAKGPLTLIKEKQNGL